MPVSENIRFTYIIILFITCFFFISEKVCAQQPKYLQKVKSEVSTSRINLFDSLLKSSKYAKLKGIKNRSSQKTGGITQPCNTSTFYMHLPVLGTGKIDLKSLQTLPDGNFVALCNITLDNDQKNGLIIKLDNDGNILSQQQIFVNGKPSVIYDMNVTVEGDIIIAGIESYKNNSVFILSVASALTTNWIKTFQMPLPVLNIKLGAVGEDVREIIFAAQLNSSVVCVHLDDNNNLLWSKEIAISGLQNLVGFNNIYGTLGLIANIQKNGNHNTQIIELDNLNGSYLKSGIIGEGNTDESKYFQVKSFYRLNLLGVKKIGANYKFERDKIYNSSLIETQHLYGIAGNVDFNVSAAMDNASDALGFCLPQDGKLVFIRQFSDYPTTPEHTVEYNIPLNASIISVTKSYDGGYLFGLNTIDSKELILIKTDSIGIIGGCNYNNIQNDFQENVNVANISVNSSTNEITVVAGAANGSYTTTDISPKFDCRQNYCPAAPAEDSCLSTYYKKFRSNSYIDLFSDYFLMRNNNQLVISSRYDRVIEGGNIITTGLKLFDEKGNFLKGVDLSSDSTAFGFEARKVDDSNILVESYSSSNNESHYTFTLVSDDLKILWSKSFTILSQYGFGGDPNTDDWYEDEEGNFYYVATNPGFFSIPRLLIYKMDHNGNKVWVKGYEFKDTYFETVKMTSTKSSLIILVDGFSNGSITARIDKQTGALQNSYNFNNEFSGSLYERVLKADNDRIFFAGSNRDENLVIGLFDTTGKPLKLKLFKDFNAIPRAGDVRNGKMYLTFDVYDNSQYNDALVKIDSSLNLEYVHEYRGGDYLIAQGLAISDNENVYVGGNSFDNYYAYPFIKKYDTKGQLGTCNYIEASPSLIDIDPQPKSITGTPFTVDIKPIDLGFDFIPDTNGPAISNILCSSVSQCDYLKISGNDIVCDINTVYNYKGQKNINCNLQPQWIYDTSYVSLKTITDSSLLISFKKTGETWLKARLNTGCKFYDDSLLITIQKTADNFTLGKDTFLCPGDSIKLNAGSGFNKYRWQDGSSDSFIVVKTPGTYFVHTSNLCGDIYADTIKVSTAFIPLLSIGNDTTICKGDTLELNASPGFVSYIWQPQSMIIGEGASVHANPILSQKFAVNARTGDGCLAQDSLLVNLIIPRPINLGIDTSFCDYDSIVLNAGIGYNTYLWNTGAQAPSIVVYKSGNYWVSAQDTNNCYAHDTLIILSVFKHPPVNLGADADLCRGNILNLDAGDYKNYLWYDATTSRMHAASNIGLYYVTVTDNNNCKGTDSIEIKSILPIPANFLNAIDSLCQYDKLQIQSSQNFVTYNWSTGSKQSFIITEVPGIFTLTVNDENGCRGSDTINVIPKNCVSGVFIPNAFTPNGDQKNDAFRAKVFGFVISFKLQIYNRFGQLIFNTTDPYRGWDGIFNGKNADTGTYVWQCSYQLQGGKAANEKGTVVLIR